MSHQPTKPSPPPEDRHEAAQPERGAGATLPCCGACRWWVPFTVIAPAGMCGVAIPYSAEQAKLEAHIWPHSAVLQHRPMRKDEGRSCPMFDRRPGLP